MKFRYFPWLGFKTLSSEEMHFYALPRTYNYWGLVFEWMNFHCILFAKATLKDNNSAS